MQEGDAFPFGACARLLIHQLDARRAASRQRGVEIRYGKTQVVNTGATTGDESPDRGIPGLGLEKLYQRVPGPERRDPGSIGVVNRNGLQAEHVPEEARLHGRGADREADVGQPYTARCSGMVFAC